MMEIRGILIAALVAGLVVGMIKMIYEAVAGAGLPVTRSQRRLVGLIVALALGRIAYSLLVHHHLEQTAALFVGLPAVLAIAIAATSPARTASGMIIKGMTIALLLSGLLLGEGFVCILFAAPLFYSIALAIGLTIDFYHRRKSRGESGKAIYGIVMLPFLAMSVEGVNDRLAFPASESVTAERVVPVTTAEVEWWLSSVPRFNEKLPLGFRLGFPTPTGSTGKGLHPGDRHVVHFATGKDRTTDLTLEVAERGPGAVRFHALSDRTPIARWLHWQEAEVHWVALDAGHTLVQWTVRYQRRLNPAWYFAPLERVAARSAAGYLIDSLATPP